MTLTVGSLFSGIGGIDLGLERAGMTVKWQSEIDPYACKVLKKHWPNTPNLGDIKQIDWSTVEAVDVIAGGYPCQPFSTAGKRQGENDPRHLWPYFRDAISGIRPRFAILENVRGHLSMGFDRVLADLTEIGYDAEWQIVSAASVGAPHRRERIICVAYPTQQYSNGVFNYARNSPQSQTISKPGNSCATQNVAYPNGTPRQQQREREVSESNLGRRSQNVAYPNGCNTSDGGQRQGLQGENTSWRDDGSGSKSDIGQVSMGGTRQDSCNVANPDGERLKECQPEREQIPRLSGSGGDVANTNSRETGGRFGGEPADRGHLSGRADYVTREKGYAGGQWWETEPDVGRVVDGVPARVDRLKGLGNAVVPQVAEYVGRLIIQSLT